MKGGRGIAELGRTNSESSASVREDGRAGQIRVEPGVTGCTATDAIPARDESR